MQTSKSMFTSTLGPAEVIVPPIGGLASTLGNAGANIADAGRPAKRRRTGRRRRRPRPGGRDRRRRREPAAAHPASAATLTDAISSLETGQAERLVRLAGARARARSATPRRRHDRRGRGARDAARRADPLKGDGSRPDDLQHAGLIRAERRTARVPADDPRLADRRRRRVVGGILFIYLFLHMVSAPSYTTLVSGVDPAQTGKMTSTLSAHGVSYQLQNNGTAIAVQANQTAQARVALAGVGAARQHAARLRTASTTPASAKATSSSRSPTSARCRDSSKRRSTASRASPAHRSTLVLPSPQTQVFGEGQTAPPRPPFCSPGPRALDPSSVRGIAQLVASAVPGLQLSKVTITGASGQLLWPSPNGAGGGSGSGGERAAGSRAALRRDHRGEPPGDARPDARPGQGPGARLREHERRPDDEGIARIRQGRDAAAADQIARDAPGQRQRARPRPAPRTSRPRPRTAASRTTRKKRARCRIGVSKTVTHSTVAPGTVESQHVSVLLDHSVPAASVPAIKEAVTNAAGINAKRGDTISIGQIAFAKGGAAGAPATSSPSRLREVRAAGHRRRGVPLLHHPLPAQARAGDDPGAALAARARGARAAAPSSSARWPPARPS